MSRTPEELQRLREESRQRREASNQRLKEERERILSNHYVDPVREYCREKKYADHVIRDGLEGMIERWDRTAAILSNPQNSYYTPEQYCNDLDGRRILEESLAVASEEQLQSALPRLAAIDQRFRAVVTLTDECIWGAKVAERRGYNRRQHWWYFTYPRYLGQDW